MKRVCKDFDIKKLGEYHDLYVKSDTLLLADVFKKFKKVYLEIYQSDPAKSISVLWLAWQEGFEKERSKNRIIRWYWYAINGWKKS